MKIYIFVPLVFAVSSLCGAADTNEFYLTDEGFLSLNHAQKLEGAKGAKESLPARDFPEGNWGTITNGFQMSLRFEKQVFTNGEPIIAIILVRNVTNRIVNYTVANVAGRDGPVRLIVESQGGEKLPPVPTDITEVISSGGRTLSPKTQHKYQERLDKRYDLKTDATYFVMARLGVAIPKLLTIESAKVRIRIESPALGPEK